MLKKSSLIGVLCISLIAMWAAQANAWFVPSPPGVFGAGCCTEFTVTTRVAGGGPLDKNTGAIADDQTKLFVSILIKEGYVVLFNPRNIDKNDLKKVTVGIGGHIPVEAYSPLFGILPAENGSGYDVDVTVPVTVDKCHSDYGDCADPLGYPDGTLSYLTDEEDKEARFLFYWNIIRKAKPEDDPLTAAQVAEQYFDIVKNGWSIDMLRIIWAEAFAYLDGKWAQGDPSPTANALTDEWYRAIEWPDPDDPWPPDPPGDDDPPLINYVVRDPGEPFAFYDHVDVPAGGTVKVKARYGVLSNDVDLGDDALPLEVVEVGPAEDDTDPGSVGGVGFETASEGWVTLNADGSFTYEAPPVDNPPVEDDYVWYKNGEISGPNESNVTVLHFGIIN